VLNRVGYTTQHIINATPQDALAASFRASDASEVRRINTDLLESLGDPFTKLLAADEEAALTAEQEGKVRAKGLCRGCVCLCVCGHAHAGVCGARDREKRVCLCFHHTAQQIVATGLGLQPVQLQQAGGEQQQQQQQQHLLVVSFVVAGSPAAAAGIQEGDVLLSVDGTPVAGQSLR
jgi:hypothetical protein